MSQSNATSKLLRRLLLPTFAMVFVTAIFAFLAVNNQPHAQQNSNGTACQLSSYDFQQFQQQTADATATYNAQILATQQAYQETQQTQQANQSNTSIVQQTATALSNVFSNPTGTSAAMPAATPLSLNQRSTNALPNTGGGAVANDAVVGQGGGAPPPQPVVQSEPVVVDEEEADIDDIITEDYGTNPVEVTSQDNLSTFAMDVDTASFTLARNYLMQYGQLPPAEAIRSEEFVNYFPMNYAQPQDDSAFAIHMDAAPSPFTDDTLLMRVGIQGKRIAPEDRDPALLIFVVDTSGSMSGQNRMGLVKQSLGILVDALGERDCVGIVEYSNQARVILPPIPATQKDTILSAVNFLQAGGSTYAEEGLRLGYELALENMQPNTTTRVILLSDGVANVGATGPDQILRTVRQGVDEGVTLSSIGVGMGNFNDVMLEQLANDGNGNYYYVDTLREAQRVFVTNLTSTLQVIGYDAKIQVEFNPDVVATYRLIGYENRAIADEDFRNDTVDAGEVGAGHSVTAMYEVTLQPNAQQGNIATTYVRYQDADTRDVVETNNTFTLADRYASFSDAPNDYQLIATVAQFAETLRGNAEADYPLLISNLLSLSAQNVPLEDVLIMVQNAQVFSER